MDNDAWSRICPQEVWNQVFGSGYEVDHKREHDLYEWQGGCEGAWIWTDMRKVDLQVLRDCVPVGVQGQGKELILRKEDVAMGNEKHETCATCGRAMLMSTLMFQVVEVYFVALCRS